MSAVVVDLRPEETGVYCRCELLDHPVQSAESPALPFWKFGVETIRNLQSCALHAHDLVELVL